MTAKEVQSLTRPGRHADGDGLYLDIDGDGRRRWVLLFTIAGRRREMGLGPLRDVSLADARRKAEAARKQVRDGIDPLEARKAERTRQRTFGEEVDALLAAKGPSWRNEKHKAQWKTTLDRYAAALLDKAVAEIGTEDVLGILQPVWQAKPETARRVRGRVEAVLAAAGAKGLREGPNPAQWKNHLDQLLPAPKRLSRGHHAALPYDKVPALVGRLRAVGGISAHALEFTILTAARSGEVLGAQWDEFDLQAGVWTVPAPRMKAGRVHRVPLPARALAILASMKAIRHDGHPFVFPGQKHRRGLSNMAMDMVLRRLGLDVTVHGFRSSFRDWAGDATVHQRELVETALAHQVGDDTERAYRRGDALEKRRQLMIDWAAFCEPKLDPTTAGDEAEDELADEFDAI
ncbi:MAG: integrase arm-type DNA-binding domain-containing protein [Burkholderiales bacterium]|nr:integrase arm-type DNA-binding domain-containing protein [Burkholderiales bacterium]